MPFAPVVAVCCITAPVALVMVKTTLALATGVPVRTHIGRQGDRRVGGITTLIRRSRHIQTRHEHDRRPGRSSGGCVGAVRRHDLEVIKPSVAAAGDVTSRVVEALAPGLIDSTAVTKSAVQPLGTRFSRRKLEAVQPVLSLLVTVMV